MDINKILIKKKASFSLYEIDIFSASDNQLMEISTHLGLALSLAEMHNIVNYFRNNHPALSDGYTCGEQFAHNHRSGNGWSLGAG